MGRPTKVDWSQLDLDWRMGVMSAREMSMKYAAGDYNNVPGPLAASTISAHFKEVRIAREKSTQAKHTRRNNPPKPLDTAIVGQALVAATHAIDAGKPLTMAQLAIATDAVLTASALISHKADIKAAREVNVALIGELQAAMVDAKSETLMTRATVCKTLVDSLAKLVALERQAYCIPDVAPEAAPTPAQAELSHDTARRFAFVLMQAAKAKAP